MDDAWKQHLDLLERFTHEIEVRPDLTVTGLAWDRCVRFTLSKDNPNHDPKYGPKGAIKYHSTTRNVGTMRELALALLAACDFVDANNPVWASNHEPNFAIVRTNT